ncbi:MAG TPA: lactonase family protein [Blastocatellia bacterium]|nr:lactonase family protein [Blastocatellia bacterium]HMV85490.1 lactonase family protein [Blastocatellia bacterium]HMX26280.1 lactonase family protein [Blastocatellia bacterium]HMY71567.1 lactonase family protein [Blastocatellia bacterium]HMZ18695.1 lactonase family protein [Blastocatellia bacterium]
MNQFDRRQFCKTAGAFAAGFSFPALPQLQRGRPNPIKSLVKDLLLYVGTYTNNNGSEGIYVYRMNPADGQLTRQSATGNDISNPSFLAIDSSKRFLYAANESGEFLGKKGGGLTSFAIDQKTGALRKLNAVTSPGVPCHVSVHPSGKFVLAANYGGGNVVIYPVKADGSLAEASDVAQHSGKGGDPKRQDGPHAHSIMLDETGTFAFAPDLGIDRVMIYRIDAKNGKLVPNGFAATKPGAGPRHFDFHPSGKFAYVISELNSTVTAFAYDKAKGALKELQTISTLPADFKATSYCADIHVHPSGKFLYGSNRGHNSIVIYAIDGSTGKLTLIGHESTRGNWPRNFGIDPTGQFLLAANQNSNSIATFRIDERTGKLAAVGALLELPAPVCLKFIPAFS